MIELSIMAILITVNQLNFGGTASAQLYERVRATGELFATMVADPLISLDLATLDAMVANSLSNDDLVYLRVLASNGAELTAGGAPDALEAAFKADLDFDAALSDHRIDLSQPIAVSGQEFGTIQIGVSTLKVEREMATALQWNLMVAAIGMTLVAFFGYVLGSVLTRQLGSLRTGAVMIAGGDLGYQIDVKGRDELAETARCFNSMARALAEDRDTLERRQSELLEKRARTRDIVATMKVIAQGAGKSPVPHAESNDEIGDMARATLVFQKAMNEVEAKRAEQARLLHAFDQLEEQVAIFDFEGACMFLNASFRASNAAILEGLPEDFTYAAYLNAGIAKSAFPGATGREDAWLADRLSDAELEQGAVEISMAPDRKILLQRTSVEGIGMVVSATDITELKTSQAQLIQASKLATLGEMATGIAHELNQPLGVIRMAANNCLKRIEKGQVDATYLTSKLTRMSDQTERAAQIIDHMRIFGRTDDGKRDNFDLTAGLENACNLMGRQLELQGVELISEFPETRPEIAGQQVMFEQVILNLISNARDSILSNASTSDAGEDIPKWVNVSFAESEPGRVSVIVTDTGGGVPEAVLDRLFDPFFTTKEPGKGTGLGLSISYGIVRDMGGILSVTNTRQGARFEINLPTAEQKLEADMTEARMA